MSLFSRTVTEPPEDRSSAGRDVPPDDAALIDPGIADELRTHAQDGRQRATDARGEAERLLADARDRARRLVADAEAQTRMLTASGKQADADADDAEQRAKMIDHGLTLRQRVEVAGRQVADLAGEYAAVTGRATALIGRLAELGREREDITTALAAARNAGDVEAVTSRWTRMTAVDEVSGTLTGQLEAARSRANAIGEAGWGGEHDRAVEVAESLRRELSDLLDGLDPGRPGRRAAQTTREYAQTLMASGMAEDQALTTAALLVAVGQYPEAALSAFGTAGQGGPGLRRQELRARDGSLIAGFSRRT